MRRDDVLKMRRLLNKVEGTIVESKVERFLGLLKKDFYRNGGVRF